MFRSNSLTHLAVAVFCVSSSFSAEPAFRADNGDDKLPWYQLKTGQFPPAGSAHAISGELIRIDHINRTGAIRMDRTGGQRTDEYDQALPFTLLPYATLSYHGAPCELRDIPLGTHLHGQFYSEMQNNKIVFSKALRLEDDFSYAMSNQKLWRIGTVDIGKSTLTVTGIRTTDQQTDAKPTVYQITPATRVWKGRVIGGLKDLEPDLTVLMNLTVCTLKGPGRCTDIWIDAESRTTATAAQLEIHRLFQREHGLACQVESVDNKQKVVTVTLFAGYDPSLNDGFKVNHHIAAAVANEDLRTHDQINDTARGPVIEFVEGPPTPGQSGVRIRFQPDILLEGYRPGKILRLFGGGWRIDDLPREERAYDG